MLKKVTEKKYLKYFKAIRVLALMYVSEPLNPTHPTDLSLAHDCEKGLRITPSDRRYHLKCFKKNKTRYAQKCNKISPPLTYHKVPPLRKDISKGKKKVVALLIL